MALFLKEQVAPSRANAAVSRMRTAGLIGADGAEEESKEAEAALLNWADACCRALKSKVGFETLMLSERKPGGD